MYGTIAWLACLACRYVTYGEQEWREATEACLKRMELYDDTSE